MYSLSTYLNSLFVILSFAFCIICCGCSSGPVADETQGDSFNQLSTIQQCYFEYSRANGKPPESKEDLAKLLEKNGQDVSTVFVSKRNNQEFVIIWNTPPKEDGPLQVIGYESTSIDNQRMVMTSMGTMTMSDEDFDSANFPPGHLPPASSQQ